jgi:hypothetical protein
MNQQLAWFALASGGVEALRTWLHHEPHIGRSAVIQILAAGAAGMIPSLLTELPLLDREIYLGILRALAALGLHERHVLLHAIDSIAADLASAIVWPLLPPNGTMLTLPPTPAPPFTLPPTPAPNTPAMPPPGVTPNPTGGGTLPRSTAVAVYNPAYG